MSNEKKQTAVEWLIEQYKLIGMITTAQINKAKEMEKEQIKTAYECGSEDGISHLYRDTVNYTSEDYYKQTYENK